MNVIQKILAQELSFNGTIRSKAGSKMDVVYTIGNGSKNKDDLELRFSLRSIEKQDWLGNVYLIGHKPEWVQNVTHIPLNDPAKQETKDKNIINKILRACAEPAISENFIVMSDDIYHLQPTKQEYFYPHLEIPSQYEQVRHIPTEYIVSTWLKRLKQTVIYCQKNNIPDFVPEFHSPYLVNKVLYPQVMCGVPWFVGNGLITHIYLNVLVGMEILPKPKEDKNLVVRVKKSLNLEEINKKTSNKVFLNHDNTGLNKDMVAFLTRNFGTISKYER